MRQDPGIAKVLADNIRRLRNEAGLGQESLAEKLDVSLPTVRAWETQIRWPGIDHISKLAKFFKVTETELFRDPNYKPETGAILAEFGRLLAKANPIAIEHALKMLAEVGQPAEAQPAHRRSRAAKP